MEGGNLKISESLYHTAAAFNPAMVSSFNGTMRPILWYCYGLRIAYKNSSRGKVTIGMAVVM